MMPITKMLAEEVMQLVSTTPSVSVLVTVPENHKTLFQDTAMALALSVQRRGMAESVKRLRMPHQRLVYNLLFYNDSEIYLCEVDSSRNYMNLCGRSYDALFMFHVGNYNEEDRIRLHAGMHDSVFAGRAPNPFNTKYVALARDLGLQYLRRCRR